MRARIVSVALAGAALSFAYQPTGWWWLAAPAVAVLIAACRGRRAREAFALGLLFGVTYFVPLLAWLRDVIGADAWLGLSAFSALWFGAAAAGTAVVMRLRWWWLWVPAVWVLVEAVSGRVPFGGWGWGRLGFSQDASPLLPLASLAGVPGLTFAVVLIAGAALAVVLAVPRGRSASVELVAPAAAFCAAWLIAVVLPVPADGQTHAGPDLVAVGLVQGNVPEAGLDFNAQRRGVLDNHVRQTLALAQDVEAGAATAPDVVLWPENASDIDPYRNADARMAIDAAARAVGVPLLVGAVVTHPQDDTRVLNQGIVWDPVAGPGDAYTKRNLVPFGEYVPFRSILSGHVSRFDQVPRDFVAGTGPGGLDIGPTRIGDAICFDVAYDDALRDAVRDGGRMLVVQTNNATYNGTSQPYQQFAMSRIRAVEHGRAVVVVSTSGLSGVIAPDGSVVPGTAIGELVPGRYVVAVAQRDSLTMSDRAGAVPEGAVAVAGLAALVAAVRRRRVADVSPGSGSKNMPSGRINAAPDDLETAGTP